MTNPPIQRAHFIGLEETDAAGILYRCFVCGKPVIGLIVRCLLSGGSEVEDVYLFVHPGQCADRLPSLLQEELMARVRNKQA